MTRILHVMHGLTGGGAERQLILLGVTQAKRGDDVHVALVRLEASEPLRDAGVHIHQIKASGHHDPLMLWRYASLVSRIKPDIVQTWLTQSDLMAGGAAILTGSTWVLSERSSAKGYPPNWKNSLRARMAHRAAAIVANSKGGTEYWASAGIPRDRLFVVPNIVDASSADGAMHAPLPPGCKGKRIILSVGRYSDEKNPFVMIDALNQALNNPATTGISDTVAVLCGAGPREAEMRARIHALNADHCIKLAGYRTDVPGLLRRSSICLSMSRYEGNPNVVLEAMAAGCPLVVSDLPAYLEVVDAASARIARNDDATDTARAICDVLNDPQAARDRAARARDHIALFAAGSIASRMDEVYDRARSDTRG